MKLVLNTVLTLGLLLLSTACESTSDKPVITSWILAPDIDSRESAHLTIGLTFDQTISEAGRPTRVRNKKHKDGTEYQIWIYERFKKGSHAVSGMRHGNTGLGSMEQYAMIKVIVTITFSSDEKIEAVNVRERNETESVFKPKTH